MDRQRYKERLLELEKDLSARTERTILRGRERANDFVADAGDASLGDETASEDFTEAELDSIVLMQARDALRRIEDGTFGQCVVDGGAIETKRLEASPWTPYCLKHQKLLEAASRPRTPTL